jgi:integration host factor subunit alpha
MTQSNPSALPDGELSASDALKTVTRADLSEAVHRHTGIGRAECAKYVEMVLDEIFEAIVTRNDVKLSSFGAFQIRAKREREGRNPKTGKEAKITARLVVTFKPSNVLRARVNSDFKVAAPVQTGDGKGNGAVKRRADGKTTGVTLGA